MGVATVGLTGLAVSGHWTRSVALAAGSEQPGEPPALVIATQASPPAPDQPAEPVVEVDRNRRISDAIRRTRSSTVALECEAGTPAQGRRVTLGVVINDAGEVLSIRVDPPADPRRASIIASDAAGHRHPARWLASDRETGLTLLRVDADDVRPIRQAPADPALGSEVFLIGNPFGLGMTVSRGHIAGLGRRLQLGPQTVAGLIQVQAPFHPGDTGAPLADLDGGWLGIFRGLGLAPGGQGEGPGNDLGFAIPAREALWVADRLRAAGKVDRAYLGLKFATDPEADGPIEPTDRPVAEAGARVVEVIAGSPADRAGLVRGDRVVGMDDRPILAAHDLTDRLERTAAGAELNLDYVRGELRRRAVVRATSRPPLIPAASALGGSASPERSTPSSTGRSAADADPIAAEIRALRESIGRLEKRVEQLERAYRGLKPLANP